MTPFNFFHAGTIILTHALTHAHNTTQTMKDAEVYENERMKREASRQRKRGGSTGTAASSRRSSSFVVPRRAGSVEVESDGARYGNTP